MKNVLIKIAEAIYVGYIRSVQTFGYYFESHFVYQKPIIWTKKILHHLVEGENRIQNERLYCRSFNYQSEFSHTPLKLDKLK